MKGLYERRKSELLTPKMYSHLRPNPHLPAIRYLSLQFFFFFTSHPFRIHYNDHQQDLGLAQ